MPNPLTRAQVLQNRAFLTVLARTGNIREAVREAGLKHATMFHRKKHHPAFAQAWDAAIATADARLHRKGGCKGPKGGTTPTPSAKPMASDGLASRPAGRARAVSRTASLSACDNALRTAGGEPVVVRRRDGKLQVRRAQPGKLTRQCEQAFLSALSATANIALSAAAAGAAEAAFYRRRRNNPAFAREMRMALEMGYERVELALLENMEPGAYADDDWRHNDPPPIPPMTVDQALQLLYLHHKTAKLWDEHPRMNKLPFETTEEWAIRRGLNYRIEHDRYLQDRAVAAAVGREPRNAERSPHEPPPPKLPDLSQVTGWSRASGKPPHHEGVALFGGWRLEDMEKKG